MPVMARSVLLGSMVAGVAVMAAATKEAAPPVTVLADHAWRGGAEALDASRVPPEPPRQGRRVCGGFSAEGRYDSVPVRWSFRLCEVGQDAYEVQLRFRNVSRRPARWLRFEYRGWLEPPGGTCDDVESEDALLLEGEKALRPGEVDEWPYVVDVAPRRAYRGEIWSCATELSDSEESS